MNAIPQTVRLIPGNGVLPPTLEQRLRKLLLDKFTGNVQLNIKDGDVKGFHVHEIITLP